MIDYTKSLDDKLIVTRSLSRKKKYTLDQIQDNIDKWTKLKEEAIKLSIK